MFLEETDPEALVTATQGEHHSASCLSEPGAFNSIRQATSASEPYLHLICIFSHFSTRASHQPPHFVDSPVHTQP